MIRNLLLVLLVLFLLSAVGLLPMWRHSVSWGIGYGPSGIFGLFVVLLIVFLVFGDRL